jgi:hypothetical protein
VASPPEARIDNGRHADRCAHTQPPGRRSVPICGIHRVAVSVAALIAADRRMGALAVASAGAGLPLSAAPYEPVGVPQRRRKSGVLAAGTRLRAAHSRRRRGAASSSHSARLHRQPNRGAPDDGRWLPIDEIRGHGAEIPRCVTLADRLAACLEIPWPHCGPCSRSSPHNRQSRVTSPTTRTMPVNDRRCGASRWTATSRVILYDHGGGFML